MINDLTVLEFMLHKVNSLINTSAKFEQIVFHKAINEYVESEKRRNLKLKELSELPKLKHEYLQVVLKVYFESVLSYSYGFYRSSVFNTVGIIEYFLKLKYPSLEAKFFVLL